MRQVRVSVGGATARHVACVHVRPPIDEEPQARAGSCRCRHVQRSHAVRSAGLDVGARIQEQLRARHVAALGGAVEGGAALLRFGVEKSGGRGTKHEENTGNSEDEVSPEV